MNERTKIRGILKEKRHIEFAYLFGSRARGTAGSRSDWDIAIYFSKPPEKLQQWITHYICAEISRKIGQEVQVIPLNKLDSPVFLFQIIKDGLLLIDNTPEHRIAWETKVLREYHDWQFYLKRQMTNKEVSYAL